MKYKCVRIVSKEEKEEEEGMTIIIIFTFF
jgi:hypothetical protein